MSAPRLFVPTHHRRKCISYFRFYTVARYLTLVCLTLLRCECVVGQAEMTMCEITRQGRYAFRGVEMAQELIRGNSRLRGLIT